MAFIVGRNDVVIAHRDNAEQNQQMLHANIHRDLEDTVRAAVPSSRLARPSVNVAVSQAEPHSGRDRLDPMVPCS